VADDLYSMESRKTYILTEIAKLGATHQQSGSKPVMLIIGAINTDVLV